MWWSNLSDDVIVDFLWICDCGLCDCGLFALLPRINVCKQIKLVNNAVLHNIFSLWRDLFFYTIIPEPLYEISTLTYMIHDNYLKMN